MANNSKIAIRRMLLHNFIELHNIAENKGIPFSLYIKKTLTKIADSFPDELKKKAENTETKSHIWIDAISEKTLFELKNICDNTGVDLGALLKIELKKIAEATPAIDKRTPLPY